MLLIKDSVLDLPKDLKNTFLMEKMERRPVNLRKLLEKKKSHNPPAPNRLEVQAVGEGSAVARKKILTGGPGSRRETFRGMTRISGCTFSGLLFFGVES